MTHIKRWIITLVLITMLVPTVNAETYESSDKIIPIEIVTTFENYFDYKPFTYFAYDLNGFTCYYGIDHKGNYLNIINEESKQYMYTGVDEDFSVNGSFSYKKNLNPIYLVAIGVVAILILKVLVYVF